LGLTSAAIRRVSDLRNTVYFRATLEPEGGEGGGAVGWAVAAPIRSYCSAAGATTGEVEREWDGVRFSCRIGKPTFTLTITPYFEATPMEWSVDVRPRSVWRYLIWLLPSETERINLLLDQVFARDPRFTVLKWESLPLR